ncbi:OmpA family protein [Acetobacter conturbans]|uniref:OmpA family protein n=1 Tax=Acetobacter conturbans TaxID=1737472 RepID=A0ABX0JZN1_9PROT|nr:OmpA family protein [Acetobacter conturbans]NHN87247.1 OmpA family protein [Acetobacter conturbans]
MRRLLSVLGLCTLAACAGNGSSGRQYVVFFGQGASDLNESAQAVVARVAERATKHPDRIVAVEGYAHQNSDLSADALLATQRAKTVTQQLVADGVSETRIRQTTRPPSNAEGVVGARRVEIELLTP